MQYKKISSLILLLLFPTFCFGAITFQSASLVTKFGNSGSPGSQSFTVSPNADRVLIIYLLDRNGAPSSVTYDGNSMTLISSNTTQNYSSGDTDYMYGLIAPPSGTHDLIITFTGTLVEGRITEYDGVDQTTGWEAAINTSGVGDHGTVIVTPTKTDWIVSGSSSNMTAADSNSTVRNFTDGDNYNIIDSNADESSAYAVGFIGNGAAQGYDMIGIGLIDATQPTPPDTTPPIVTVPTTTTVQATDINGATVTFTAMSTDDTDGVIIPFCSPASGSIFAIGTTTVSCGAVDAAGNTATSTFDVIVSKLDPSITWNNPADITYGTALSDTQLDATSTISGTFVYTPPAGTVLPIGEQALHVDFTPTDSASYNTASTTVFITIDPAPQPPVGNGPPISNIIVPIPPNANPIASQTEPAPIVNPKITIQKSVTTSRPTTSPVQKSTLKQQQLTANVISSISVATSSTSFEKSLPILTSLLRLMFLHF